MRLDTYRVLLIFFPDLLNDYIFVALDSIIHVDQRVLIFFLDQRIFLHCSYHGDGCWVATNLLKHVMAGQRFNLDLFVIVDFKPHNFLDFLLKSRHSYLIHIFKFGHESCERIIFIFEQEIANVITLDKFSIIQVKLYSKLFTELWNENELWIYLVW